MFIVTSSHVKPYHFYTVKRIFHESYVGIKYTHTHTHSICTAEISEPCLTKNDSKKCQNNVKLKSEAKKYT